jgi:hypothetical protein
MKDLVINKPAAKKKWSKRQKKESIVEAAQSVGENQPVWLDSLKEELAKMKWALEKNWVYFNDFWTDGSRGKEI